MSCSSLIDQFHIYTYLSHVLVIPSPHVPVVAINACVIIIEQPSVQPSSQPSAQPSRRPSGE